MMWRIIILPLLWIALPAQAANWVKMQEAGGDQLFYDNTKLHISGDEITYWKKVVFNTAQPVKGQLAASGLFRERIHCAEHTLKLISYLFYNADGGMIDYVPEHDAEAAPIIPDAIGDLFEKKLCPLVWQKQEEQRRIKAEQEEKRIRLEAKKAEAAAAIKPAEPVTIKPQPPAAIRPEPAISKPAEPVVPAVVVPPAAPAPKQDAP